MPRDARTLTILCFDDDFLRVNFDQPSRHGHAIGLLERDVRSSRDLKSFWFARTACGDHRGREQGPAERTSKSHDWNLIGADRAACCP
jgi:hypothetical protein